MVEGNTNLCSSPHIYARRCTRVRTRQVPAPQPVRACSASALICHECAVAAKNIGKIMLPLLERRQILATRKVHSMTQGLVK